MVDYCPPDRHECQETIHVEYPKNVFAAATVNSSCGNGKLAAHHMSKEKVVFLGLSKLVNIIIKWQTSTHNKRIWKLNVSGGNFSFSGHVQSTKLVRNHKSVHYLTQFSHSLPVCRRKLVLTVAVDETLAADI